MKRRHRTVSLEKREEWKQEYRTLSGEIHAQVVSGEAVPPEKANRLRALGRYLRSQSGE